MFVLASANVSFSLHKYEHALVVCVGFSDERCRSKLTTVKFEIKVKSELTVSKLSGLRFLQVDPGVLIGYFKITQDSD